MLEFANLFAQITQNYPIPALISCNMHKCALRLNMFPCSEICIGHHSCSQLIRVVVRFLLQSWEQKPAYHQCLQQGTQQVLNWVNNKVLSKKTSIRKCKSTPKKSPALAVVAELIEGAEAEVVVWNCHLGGRGSSMANFWRSSLIVGWCFSSEESACLIAKSSNKLDCFCWRHKDSHSAFVRSVRSDAIGLPYKLENSFSKILFSALSVCLNWRIFNI